MKQPSVKYYTLTCTSPLLQYIFHVWIVLGWMNPRSLNGIINRCDINIISYLHYLMCVNEPCKNCPRKMLPKHRATCEYQTIFDHRMFMISKPICCSHCVFVASNIRLNWKRRFVHCVCFHSWIHLCVWMNYLFYVTDFYTIPTFVGHLFECNLQYTGLAHWFFNSSPPSAAYMRQHWFR